jgi:hypothetical protein
MSDREKLRRAERHRRSFTVDEWCDARRISRGMFYKLRDRGLAPKTHKCWNQGSDLRRRRRGLAPGPRS